MTSRKIILTSLFMLASFILGHAQSSQYDKGTPPQHAAGLSAPGSYVSTELGTVNLSNGGLNFNIPLGTVGGRGNVSLPLVLSYSSKVWSASMDVDIERESGTEQSVAFADYDNHSTFQGAAAPGWSLGAGVYLNSTFVRIQRIMSGPSVGCYSYGLHKLTLNLPDKGEIEFRDDLTNGAPLPLNCTTQQTASRGTRWQANNETVFRTAGTFGFTVNYRGTNAPALPNTTAARGHNDHGHLGFSTQPNNIQRYRVIQTLPNGAPVYGRVP